MLELKKRIVNEGKNLGGGILKVDSLINHQVDPQLMDECGRDFARRFAEALSTAEPERFVAKMSKAKRHGRIFIDWLRNQRGSMAVTPYSARARPGLPVAIPIAWDELKSFNDAHPFSIRDGTKLVERAATRPLAGWGFAAQKLPAI